MSRRDVARVEATLLAEGGPFEIVDVEVGGVTIKSFKNRIRTLRDLLLKSVDFGDNTYMLATDGVHERRLSFAEHARAGRVGRGRVPRPLRRAARRPGRDPRRELRRSGSSRSGRRSVSARSRSGLNGWSTGPEIRYFLDDCEPKVLVADRKRVERIEGAIRAFPSSSWRTTSPSSRRTPPTPTFADARGRRGRSRDHPLHVGHDGPAQGCDQHAPQRGVVPDDQLLQRREGDDARAAARARRPAAVADVPAGVEPAVPRVGSAQRGRDDARDRAEERVDDRSVRSRGRDAR